MLQRGKFELSLPEQSLNQIVNKYFSSFFVSLISIAKSTKYLNENLAIQNNFDERKYLKVLVPSS